VRKVLQRTPLNATSALALPKEQYKKRTQMNVTRALALRTLPLEQGKPASSVEYDGGGAPAFAS
jgi:hypothetical protein